MLIASSVRSLMVFLSIALQSSSWIRRNGAWGILALGAGLVLSPNALAEPPAITSLFPAGVQRGTTTELKLTGKPGTQPVHVSTQSTGFSDFQFSEKGDVLTLTVAEDTTPGLYWIRFYNTEGATALLPIIVGAIPEQIESEPNNSHKQAEKIDALPKLINGALHQGGEVDTFAVTLAAGETLIASVDAHESFGSPMDAVLQILDVNGFVVAHNDDDHGFDPLLAFQAPAEGTYLVRIFCFPAAPNSTINFAGGADYVYRLTLTSGPFLSSAPPIASSAQGWNLTGSPESVPDLDSYPGLHPYFNEKTDLPIINQPSVSDQVHSGPVAISGELSRPEERDRFTISAKKGESLRIRVYAREIGSLLDPVLSILKLDQSLLKESDDLSREDRDVDLSWKSPADENYLLEISDRYQHGGFRYTYLLEVSNDVPRVELTLASDRFQIEGGKPLEIPVTVNRLSGFDQEITVTALDLPEGVVVEPVVSQTKGDSSKKVVLKIDSGTGGPYQGPLRIVGTHGAEIHSIAATAPLSLLKQTTSNIWLTILAPKEEKSKE